MNWKLPKKLIFNFFLLPKKLKIELKIAQNQFWFFWNYWKLNRNEMDLFVHECTCTISVYFVHSIFNSNFWLKIDFYCNFQSNLISNSLIRFWILKNKSIMEIQFLKWKLKNQFSIFNFWNWDLDNLSILIFCFSNNI